MGKQPARWRTLRLWGPDPEGDVTEELSFHLESRVQELMARGFTREEAEREARTLFGDLDHIRSELHEMGRKRLSRVRRAGYLDELRQDVRQAFRSFARRPGTTAIVVFTLALGMGVTTAVYALFDRVVMNPLPVRGAEQLISVHERWSATNTHAPISYPVYRALRERAKSVAGIAGYTSQGVALHTGDFAQHTTAVFASVDYFALLGVQPIAGRLFQPSDEGPAGSAPYVVLSEEMWEQAFGRRADIVGQTIAVNNHPRTVIGVAPAWFRGTDLTKKPAAWLPLNEVQAVANDGLFRLNIFDTHAFRWVSAFARIAPGKTAELANGELVGLYRVVISETSSDEVMVEAAGTQALETGSLVEAATGRDRASLLRFVRILVGVVAICLLIGCVNVALLLLLRSRERLRDFVVRRALGAGSGRLFRQLAVENLVLSTLSVCLGLLLAVWGIRALSVFSLPSDIRIRDLGLSLDGGVLLFSITLSAIAALGFGIAPTLIAARGDVAASLRSARHGARRRGWRAGSVLISVQVALTLVLVVGALLFIRSLREALNVDLRFDPRGIASVSIDIQRQGYRRDAAGPLFRRIVEEMRSHPALRETGLATHVPVSSGKMGIPLTLADDPTRSIPITGINAVTPGYLDLIGARVSTGRAFSASDDENAAPVAVLNQTAARAMWPDQDPIGRQFRIFSFGNPYTVVGVVADAHYTSLSAIGPYVFVPLQQNLGLGALSELQLVARGPGSAAATIDALRQIVRGIDSRMPVFDEMDVAARIDRMLMPQRFGSLLLGFLAILALLISAVGIYAVAAYEVVLRRRELGIRAALGADTRDLAHVVLARNGLGIAVGCIAGMVLAFFSSAATRTFLFGIRPDEPASYAFGAILLAVTAVAASWLPSRRAAHADPARIMRE